MIEDDLRAAFARRETLTPPADPLRAAIDRTVVRRRRRRLRLRMTGTALAVAAGLLVGVPAFTPDRPVPSDATLIGDRHQQAAPAGALNVLLLGVDSWSGPQPPLADSILLVHVPADRSRLYLVSVPRDLRVAIPGYGTDKLNAAFVRGSGDGKPDLARGYDLTRSAVADLTGVRIDAGGVLTYPVLRKLTDAVGGVDVCLPDEVRSIHTRRIFPAGCQHLDGSASVDLLRQRRGLPDGAQDRDRNAQRYAAGLLRAAERDLLHNPVKVSQLLSEIGPDLVADTGSGSLVDLLAVAPELKSVEPVGLRLPVVLSDGVRYSYELDRKAAPAFLTALREDRLGGWVAANPDRVTGQR